MMRPINCAHRGASKQAPENTLVALRKAVRLGADMAEIDIQQTVDDRLVLFHDDDLGRTSDGAGPLWEKTLGQLKGLDVGSWFAPEFHGETVPTLEEALTFARGRLELNIEMKMHGHERDLEHLVANQLRTLDCLDWCQITSFDHAAVDRLLKILPEAKVGYIVGRGHWSDSLLESPVSVLSLERSLVHEERVRRIQATGKEVHVWTVDEVAEMKQLQALGVDALISNHPDRVAAFLRSG